MTLTTQTISSSQKRLNSTPFSLPTPRTPKPTHLPQPSLLHPPKPPSPTLIPTPTFTSTPRPTSPSPSFTSITSIRSRLTPSFTSLSNPFSARTPATPRTRKPSLPKQEPKVQRTCDRITGLITGKQEIHLGELLAIAWDLDRKGENPLLKAVSEVVEQAGLEGVEMMGRMEYGLVERRLEAFIMMRGGECPGM